MERGWQKDLPALESTLEEMGVPLGVIINGDPRASSDSAWTNAAFKHLEAVEDLAGIRVADLIFETWDNRPTQMLPEYQDGTLTGLALVGSREPEKLVSRVRGQCCQVSSQVRRVVL